MIHSSYIAGIFYTSGHIASRSYTPIGKRCPVRHIHPTSEWWIDTDSRHLIPSELEPVMVMQDNWFQGCIKSQIWILVLSFSLSPNCRRQCRCFWRDIHSSKLIFNFTDVKEMCGPFPVGRHNAFMFVVVFVCFARTVSEDQALGFRSFALLFSIQKRSLVAGISRLFFHTAASRT